MYVIYANVYTPTHARIFKNKNMHNKLINKRKKHCEFQFKKKPKAQCKRKEWQRQHLMSFLVLYL